MTERQLPQSIEAEQALLGCVLFDNGAFETLDGLLPEHFYEPVHGRIYETIGVLIGKGQLADPILVNEELRGVASLEQMGGLGYLVDLVDHAGPASNAREYSRVIVDKALRRALISQAEEQIAGALDPEFKATDTLSSSEARLYSLAETSERGRGIVSFKDAMRGAVEGAREAFSRDGALSGLSTGLIDLDAKLGGLHPSDLIILAARPSMGKTSLATNIGFTAARAGKQVLFASLEMSAEQLAARVAADWTAVSSDKMRKGEITEADLRRLLEAEDEIGGIPLHIDATGGLALAKLNARARRLSRTCGLDLIIVDYLQLVTGDRSKGDGRTQEIGQITMGLKALAKDLSVPVIALAQLSRAVEQRDDKRPQLSDLRESGSIEQDADCVIFIYRDEYYMGRAEPRPDTPEHLQWQEDMDRVAGLAELIIGKQRHGPIGTVRVAFNADLTKFHNLARDHYFHGQARDFSQSYREGEGA